MRACCIHPMTWTPRAWPVLLRYTLDKPYATCVDGRVEWDRLLKAYAQDGVQLDGWSYWPGYPDSVLPMGILLNELAATPYGTPEANLLRKLIKMANTDDPFNGVYH